MTAADNFFHNFWLLEELRQLTIDFFWYCHQVKNPFVVDKKKMLKVVKDVIDHLQEPDKICLSVGMDWDDIYDSEDSSEKEKIIDFRHNLKIIELQLDGVYDPDDINTKAVQKEFYRAIDDGDWQVASSIEIHSGSFIENDRIHLTAFLHETSAECDISYPVFTYDDMYKCWIIKDSFWSARNGVDCNGVVTILAED